MNATKLKLLHNHRKEKRISWAKMNTQTDFWTVVFSDKFTETLDGNEC